jgi:hypothetical protein
MKERSALLAVVLVASLAFAPWACGSSGSDNGSPDASTSGSSGGSSGGSSSGATSSGSSGGSSSGATSSGSSSGSSSGAASSGSSSGSASSGSGSGGGDAGTDSGPGLNAGDSVLQVGHDVYHRMNYTQPTLTQAAVTGMAPDTTFDTNATYPANGNTTGQGLPSVLYLENGPPQAGCPAGSTTCKATSRAAGAGIFLAFPGLGASPNVFAFDDTTGLPTWTSQVKNGVDNGGDGIRGTPAIDLASRRVFIVTGNNPHTVHALSVDTGVEVTTGGWPITLSLSTLSYQDAGFNSANQNQRGALLLVGNTLYIPFGGEDGDGGTYRGWVVAIDITNPATIGAWATLSPQSGIWASGGLASDGTYVFAETGNSAKIRASTTPMSAWDSEEVVRLSGLAKPTRDGTSVFVANEWLAWDQTDKDLGSSSPAIAPLGAGSNPPSIVIAPGKAGALYFLNGGNLSSGVWPGDAGGELSELAVANTGAQSIYTAPTVYTSASGLHAAIGASASPFALCPTATKNAAGVILSVLIKPGGSPLASVSWCADNEVGTGSRWFPPISTTSDGVSADPIVWFLSSAATAGSNQLTAVNGDDGTVLFQTTGTACPTVPSLSFPIAVKGHIVVAAIGHLCSWSVGGK